VAIPKTSTPDPWADVRKLKVGGHLHLDRLVDTPPPPGSPNWVPLMLELVERLIDWGGPWTVTLTLGMVRQSPDPASVAPNFFERADTAGLAEPPAVYRLADRLIANIWEGEYRCWKVVRQPGVTEIVSLHRAASEPPDDQGWHASLLFEVRHAPR
jgi:hypothetical protein